MFPENSGGTRFRAFHPARRLVRAVLPVGLEKMRQNDRTAAWVASLPSPNLGRRRRGSEFRGDAFEQDGHAFCDILFRQKQLKHLRLAYQVECQEIAEPVRQRFLAGQFQER
jgi:hypothetical protein